MSRFSIWSFISVLVSLGVLGLVLSRADVGASCRVLAQLDALRATLPILVTVAALAVRAWRWQMIFPREIRPPLRSCVSALAIGNLTNNLAPARGGDLVRCFLILHVAEPSRAASALATVGVEKVLDGLVLVTIVLASFLVFHPPSWLAHLSVLAAIGFGASFLVLLALRCRPAWFPQRLRTYARRLLGLLSPRVISLGRSFAEGLNAMNSARHMAALTVLTGLVWASDAALVWGLATALHLPLSLPNATMVSAVLGLGLAVPAAPASLGTYELFSVTALGLTGLGVEAALALTLLAHAWSLLATTTTGLLALGFSGMTVRQLFRRQPLLEGSAPSHCLGRG